MRGDFVALDLETTGLDSTSDSIIEFGAVRFRNGEVTAEYSTLINPGRPIPPEITALTGISDADFLSKPHKPDEAPLPPAPSLAQALPAIRSFVGDAPIIGHNVGFDLSFLYPHGLFQNNFWVDTYDLAAVLLPSATRYSLSSLSKHLNIELNEAHRALHDARASALLYWEMWKQIQTLPVSLIHEIVNISQGMDWNARMVFEYALEEKTAAAASPNPFSAPIFSDTPTPRNTLVPAPASSTISLNEVDNIFGEDGVLANHHENYESRPGQIEMAHKIAEAFNQSHHLVIEAGTGIGKSLAYLVPAVMWATTNQQQVVISTNTLNLQDQLGTVDIPLLKEIIPAPFQAAVLKGRGNYLCLNRLSDIRRRRPSTTDEMRVLAKVLVWLTRGGSGEKNDINLRGFVEQNIWQRLSAEAENCTPERCEVATGGKCPYHRARKAADAAHIVIVNHALLLADATSENQVIPDYQHLIIDEAHHLEEAATGSLTTRTDETAIKYHLLNLATNKHSFLGEVISKLQEHVPPHDSNRLIEFLKNLQIAATTLETHIAKLFVTIRNLASRNDNDIPVTLRITAETRRKAEFGALDSQWNIVSEFLGAISDGLGRLPSAFGKLKSYSIPEFDNLVASIAAAAHYFAELQQTFQTIIRLPDDNLISWIHINNNNVVSVHTAPLNVGTMLDTFLWSKKKSVILTSATLQTNGNFDYLEDALKTNAFDTLAIDSPFNYRESTLVFVPNDMPDPNERGRFQQAVERALVELTASLGGRTLALFTSYTQLQQTAQAIRPRLALGDITVYDQLDSNNRQALLESFKTTDKAILLGTKSFWEGVDIPGATLSALVLTKLPFPIPTDPIISARSERYSDSFKEYTLPETILRFRQGFGRLIRSQSDRGVVVLLDKRLISKSYGQSFMDSLPDCTIQYGTLQSLAETAQKWVEAGN